MACYIYGLICPVTGELRYIGKSVDPSKRLRRHIEAAYQPKNYNQRWIATLVKEGLRPGLRILHEVTGAESWADVERSMIASARASGVRLTNTAVGGEGVLLLDPEAEAKRQAAIKAAWNDPALKAEQAERVRSGMTEARRIGFSLRSKEFWADPKYAAKVGAAVKAAYSNPEARRAQANRSKAAHSDPKIEARRSKSLSNAWHRDGAREQRVASLRKALAQPETRQRKSDAVRERHKDPEQKARMMKGLSDPAMIARRNLAIKAAKARRKAEKEAIDGAH